MTTLGTKVAPQIQVRWRDPPGLYPGDIRSRHVSIHLSPPVPNSQNGCMVWRSRYACNGACQRNPRKRAVEEFDDAVEELKSFAQAARLDRGAQETEEDDSIDSKHQCKAVLVVSIAGSR